MQNRAMCHAWLPNSHPLPKGRCSGKMRLDLNYHPHSPLLLLGLMASPYSPRHPTPPAHPPHLVFSGQADILDILQRLKDKEPLAPNKAALYTPPEWEIWKCPSAVGGRRAWEGCVKMRRSIYNGNQSKVLGKGAHVRGPVSRKWSAFTFQGLMSAVTLKQRETPQSNLILTRGHTDTLGCVYKRAIFSITAIALRGTCNTQGPTGRFSSLALIHHTPLLYLSPPSPIPSFSAANYSSTAFSRK